MARIAPDGCTVTHALCAVSQDVQTQSECAGHALWKPQTLAIAPPSRTFLITRTGVVRTALATA